VTLRKENDVKFTSKTEVRSCGTSGHCESEAKRLDDKKAQDTANNSRDKLIRTDQDANARFLRQKAKEVSFDALNGTKYVPLETIGTGAYGVVCAALDKKTKEKVAVKKIPNAMEMFIVAKRTYREIKILRHFNHENIIGIRDIITHPFQDPKSLKQNPSAVKDIFVVLDFMESDLHHIIHSKQVG
jgi:mitogen-activated protein kinase 7